MLPTKFRFVWPSYFRREDVLEINQSETRIACGMWRPCSLTDREEMSNLYRGHSIDASYQVSVQLAKWFQRRTCFFNLPIRNKNYLWRQCLLKTWNEMRNRYRGLSIDAPYQVSNHLAQRF